MLCVGFIYRMILPSDVISLSRCIRVLFCLVFDVDKQRIIVFETFGFFLFFLSWQLFRIGPFA